MFEIMRAVTNLSCDFIALCVSCIVTWNKWPFIWCCRKDCHSGDNSSAAGTQPLSHWWHGMSRQNAVSWLPTWQRPLHHSHLLHPRRAWWRDHWWVCCLSVFKLSMCTSMCVTCMWLGVNGCVCVTCMWHVTCDRCAGLPTRLLPLLRLLPLSHLHVCRRSSPRLSHD